MAKKKTVSTAELEQLVERLRHRPELCEQVRQILDLSDPSQGGKGLDINQLEGFLRPTIRETGRVAIKEFAEQSERDAADALKQEMVDVQQREKKR